MAYTLPTWANSPSTSSPLSAANLTLANGAINDLDTRTGVLEVARSSLAIYASDYGAVGNNSTDDTTALQNALNAVPSNGTLHLAQNKTYRITAALTGLSLKAVDGHGSTIRQATTSANALTGVDVVNFSLRDITIAGATDSSPASTGKGISITRSARPDTFRVNLERVIVHSHGGDGIDISNPITSHFENVEVRNCAGHGFNIHGVSGGAAGTSVVFAGTYANTNIKAGYRLDTMAYCAFVGAAADGNGIGYEVVACQSVSFTGCGAEAQLNNNGVAAGYAGYSWKITGGYGVTLTGCWAYAQPAIALWITGSAQAVVATGFIENSPAGTATACIKTDAGVTSTLIHNSNATANNLAGLDLIVHDGGGLSVPGYGYFAGALTSAPATLTDAVTIATNAAQGNTFRVTLGGNRTLGNPTNPTNGQTCTWELIQDATGSRTLTLGAAFALGTTIASATLTTTANARDFLTAIYNSTTAKWYVIDFVKGY